MGKTKTNKRKKIITKKLFQTLWEAAEKEDSKEEYMRKFSNASAKELRVAKEKCGLKYTEYLLILSECYEKQHLSFKEILEQTNTTKAEIARTFCIPIRTVEEWHTGNNNCNSYIRLMLLRHYYLFNLGKYIHMESEEEHENLKPKTYNKGTVLLENKEVPVESEKEDESAEDMFDNFDSFLASIRKQREKISQTQVNETKTVMDKTSFIDDIIRRTKK